jgi:hypothetical protein
VDEEVPDDTTISYFRAKRLGEEKFRQFFDQIVRQCQGRRLVKGKRQIIDSTHIQADVARNSLAGLVRMCRRNVLQDIAGQDGKLAFCCPGTAYGGLPFIDRLNQAQQLEPVKMLSKAQMIGPQKGLLAYLQPLLI